MSRRPPFPLEIVMPEGIVYDGSVRSLRVPGIEGRLTVLHGHQPLVAGLNAGTVHLLEADGNRRSLRIGMGVLTVSSERSRILASLPKGADADGADASSASEMPDEPAF